jgi:dolichol-phosphate mannosyltransferase
LRRGPVLVTGAGGFVGANLVRALRDKGRRVVAAGGGWRLRGLEHDVELVDLDVRDAEAVNGLVARTRPEHVFHLAAHGAYSWQTDRPLIFETNLQGTINVLEAAHAGDVASVVAAGSSSEYGFKDHAPSETEVLEPNSDYAVAKAAASQFAAFYGRQVDLRVTWLRLYSVYGPFEDPRRLVPRLLVHGLRGELPPLADPGAARDFVHVDDVCDAFLRAAERDGERTAVYNVASGTQTTLADIVRIVRELFAIQAEPAWGSMPGRTWDTSSWVGDATKIRAELGWQPSVSLADGLERTAVWLRSDPSPLEIYAASG